MSDIIYNKPYSMSEMCAILNIKYDSSHSKDSLMELEKLYVIERKSRYKYCFVRELSTEERLEAIVYGKNKQLLRPIIITTLSKNRQSYSKTYERILKYIWHCK